MPAFHGAGSRRGGTQFYGGRSLAQAATGDTAGALADTAQQAGAAPQRAESYYARGVARALLGRDRDVIADFDRAAAARLRDERGGCGPCLDPFRYQVPF
ncbi:MAG: hypothetical protein ACHQ52_06010 [Candidatus Eisenbacteria bacterium]